MRQLLHALARHNAARTLSEAHQRPQTTQRTNRVSTTVLFSVTQERGQNAHPPAVKPTSRERAEHGSTRAQAEHSRAAIPPTPAEEPRDSGASAEHRTAVEPRPERQHRERRAYTARRAPARRYTPQDRKSRRTYRRVSHAGLPAQNEAIVESSVTASTGAPDVT
jgi:hypothetical protein